MVNGSDSTDFPETTYSFIDYEDLNDLENAFVIIEDVVRPSDAESKMLNNLLVRTKRHSNVVVHVICHNITKNNIYSLVQHFDYVVITNSAKNTSLVKNYSKHHYPGDPAIVMRTWDSFRASSSMTHYLSFNIPSATFSIVDEKGLEIVNSQDEIRKKIERCMRPFPNQQEALSLFEFLFAALPQGSLQTDLVLTVQTPSGEVSLSIIDLIGFVTHSDSPPPPNEELVSVFHVLQKLYKIPYLFIRNSHFTKGK